MLVFRAAFCLMFFGQSEQFACGQLEELSDIRHGSKCRAFLASFDLTDVAEVISERMSKILLSHATLGAQLRHRHAESFFGGMGDTFNGCSDRSGHTAMVPGRRGL